MNALTIPTFTTVADFLRPAPSRHTTRRALLSILRRTESLPLYDDERVMRLRHCWQAGRNAPLVLERCVGLDGCNEPAWVVEERKLRLSRVREMLDARADLGCPDLYGDPYTEA